ncbi:MAG TPA: thiamine pyrophosphate-binding protein, partial [Streptosporangiaceae bacterium]
MTDQEERRHGGALAVEVARGHGVTHMFTLSGGHVFPLYDGAVHSEPPLPLVDVRHEQTAVFAAEATARLTRSPGLAVVTAGPGVTNSVSAVTTAHFNGAPVVVLGGRAPDYRWGAGSLQEIDHPPLLAPVTKRAWTEHATAQVAGSVDEAFRLAGTPHRGPVFLDVSLEAIYDQAAPDARAYGAAAAGAAPDPGVVGDIADRLAQAQRPVLVLGSDVWLDGAEDAARACAEAWSVPVIANGQGRGILPAGHPQLITRARSVAFREADLVVVAGAPLDFRLGYGQFGAGDEKAPVIHVADSPGQLATHCPLAAAAAGDLSAFFAALGTAPVESDARDAWLAKLQETARAAIEADGPLLASAATPIHPMRIYGELNRVLADDAVIIGDGGDFVS